MPAARGLIGRADGKLNAENGKCAELIHQFPQIGVAYDRVRSGDGVYSPNSDFIAGRIDEMEPPAGK